MIYENAGLIFPDSINKHLEEVLVFHRTIVKNRKEYLNSEIARITAEVLNQDVKIESLTSERAKILEILETHGALDEYSKLLNTLLQLKQKLEKIQSSIENLTKFEDGISNLKIEKEKLLQKIRKDFQEREVQRESAIRYFDNNCEKLYSEPGTLSIEPTESGYKFKVEIKRAKSDGVGRMKVFCYDLMLIQIWSRYQDMPGFLIHDSTIFDAVDERQVAKAMELAAEEAENKGFQYICTINSDKVPYGEFTEGFTNKFR